MFYKRVYSPEGEAFDVPTARANELILQDGWTQQKPAEEAKPAPKPKKTRSRKRAAPVEEVVEPVEEPVEDEGEQFTFPSDEPAADLDD